MTSYVRMAVAAATAAFVLLLGACSATPSDDASSPSASTTTKPAPSASGTASPSSTPAPSGGGGDASLPAGDVSTGGITPVEIGMPFRDALAATSATPGCAWAGFADAGGYTLTMLRESDGDDSSPVVLVSATVPRDAVATIGPRTAEGIGIGSTAADVRAAYPDAQEVSDEGGTRYLQALALGDGGVFFALTDGDVVWSVTSTVLPVLPTEYCG